MRMFSGLISHRLVPVDPSSIDVNPTDIATAYLSTFPWATFRSIKAAVKLHTLLDLRDAIPGFIHISDGRLHDVNVLDLLLPEAGEP